MRRLWAIIGGLSPHVLSAGAGALVMAAVLIGIWLAGLAPSRESNPPNINVSAPSEQTLTALTGEITALNRRLDDLATLAHDATARANAASTAAEAAKNAAQGGIQHSDIDALNGKVAALEATVKNLSDDLSKRAANTGDRAARATVAAEALRTAVASGGPYRSELATVKSLGTPDSVTAPLEQFAAEGVPSTPALAHELSALTPSLLRASNAGPSDNTFFGRLQSNAQKLVRITPLEAPAGDDPSSIVARISADAVRADLVAAIADIARLPQAARALAEPWIAKAEARNAAIAASRHIVADALNALGKPGSQ
jgi:hypothetical protein